MVCHQLVDMMHERASAVNNFFSVLLSLGDDLRRRAMAPDDQDAFLRVLRAVDWLQSFVCQSLNRGRVVNQFTQGIGGFALQFRILCHF